MGAVSLCLSLTPHGRVVLTHDADAPPVDSGLADRLLQAFERGSGHGLLLLGADEAGTALPPVYSYWREFGARYVTRGGQSEIPEGHGRSRCVVIEFPDYAAARACYRSAEYVEARKLRLGASEADILIVEGYDGPQP